MLVLVTPQSTVFIVFLVCLCVYDGDIQHIAVGVSWHQNIPSRFSDHCSFHYHWSSNAVLCYYHAVQSDISGCCR